MDCDSGVGGIVEGVDRRKGVKRMGPICLWSLLNPVVRRDRFLGRVHQRIDLRLKSSLMIGSRKRDRIGGLIQHQRVGEELRSLGLTSSSSE